MHDRKSCLLAAALVAALAAGAGAEAPFENAVNAAMGPQGALGASFAAQKQLNAAQAALIQSDFSGVQDDAVLPGGRPGPGPRPPAPRPPAPRPPHPPTPRPPSPRPPAPRPPDHPTHRLPPDRNHQDWGRWHGHPGWGHEGRWDWDRWGRPHWWGWIIWTGEAGMACRDYYGNELIGCDQDCAAGNDACVQACDGDSDCAAQCGVNSGLCRDSCEEDYDSRVVTCP